MTRSNFWLYFVCLFSVSLIISGCKKTFLDQQEPLEQASILAGNGNMTIDMQDVLTAMPQTLLYNMGSDFKLYAGRSEWVFKEHALHLRIPTTTGYGSYIYALKYYDQPNSLHIYAVSFVPDVGSDVFDPNFNGIQQWINFQDWHAYSVKYENGSVVSHTEPLKLAEPNWEECGLENGLFYFNNEGKIEMLEEETSGYSVLSHNLGCPNVNPKPGFFNKIKNWIDDISEGIGNVINDIGDWFGGLGDSIGGAPGPGYGSPGNGTPGSPGGPGTPPPPGGPGMPPGGPGGPGSYYPPTDPPPTHPDDIWENNFKPLDEGYVSVVDDDGGGNFYNPSFNWRDQITHPDIVVEDNNALVRLLVKTLGLDEDGRDWLIANPTKAFKISEFIVANHPNLTLFEILDIAREHLRLMMEESEYESFIDYFPGNWWDRDQDDFMYSRIKALEIYVGKDPYDMLDCDEMDELPMELYQEVGSYTIPLIVLDKIDDIRADNPIYNANNFKILKIEDARGGVVNCDYFTVKIDQFPKQNGVTMNPGEFLEYFRKNKDSFIDQHINVSFQPYIHKVPFMADVDETIKFNMPYEQSLGALVHIDMLDDGTVIESGYQQNFLYQNWYMFSTMTTPKDFAHPVAGNRKFGIKFENGSYYFYIMGVDRTNDLSTTIANWAFNAAFQAADELWQNIQINLKSYINSNQGVSTTLDKKIARPSWDYVSLFLEGKINYQTFKSIRNCL